MVGAPAPQLTVTVCAPAPQLGVAVCAPAPQLGVARLVDQVRMTAIEAGA